MLRSHSMQKHIFDIVSTQIRCKYLSIVHRVWVHKSMRTRLGGFHHLLQELCLDDVSTATWGWPVTSWMTGQLGSLPGPVSGKSHSHGGLAFANMASRTFFAQVQMFKPERVKRISHLLKVEKKITGQMLQSGSFTDGGKCALLCTHTHTHTHTQTHTDTHRHTLSPYPFSGKKQVCTLTSFVLIHAYMQFKLYYLFVVIVWSLCSPLKWRWANLGRDFLFNHISGSCALLFSH